MKIVLLGVGLCLTALLLRADPLVRCQYERYFEGERVSCIPSQSSGASGDADGVTFVWSIYGKELKREHWKMPWPVKTLPAIQFEAPQGLRAVTRLRLDAIYQRDKTGETVLSERTQILLFPRDASYWTGENEFKNKTIVVEASAARVTPILDALHIPYVLDDGHDLQALKRVDLRLRAADVKGLDPRDPWSRWTLVELLRKTIIERRLFKGIARVKRLMSRGIK